MAPKTSLSQVHEAIKAIGLGYDITSDIRLKHCKRDSSNSCLIELDHNQTHDVVLPGGLVVADVPKSIRCDKGERIRFRSDVLSFQQSWNNKPPIEELHQFLDFQLPRQWAPVYCDLQLGPQRRKQSSASLQFAFMGPKLYVNTSVIAWIHQLGRHSSLSTAYIDLELFSALNLQMSSFEGFGPKRPPSFCSQDRRKRWMGWRCNGDLETVTCGRGSQLRVKMAQSRSIASSDRKSNGAMVDVGKKPVTGLRLYLEGKRSNRLAIHLQHLCSRPQFFQLGDNASNHFSTDSHDRKYYEPVSWQRFSHVCTAPVEADDDLSIVTGAQLHVEYHGLKKVLFLGLQFSSVSNAVLVKDPEWEGSPNLVQKSGLFSTLMSTHFSMAIQKPPPRPADVNINSAVYPGGPPVPVPPKLLKFVDTTEMSRGPQDSPGYWVVSGAKLHLERGKISLRAKYSLLTAILPDEEYEHPTPTFGAYKTQKELMSMNCGLIGPISFVYMPISLKRFGYRVCAISHEHELRLDRACCARLHRDLISIVDLLMVKSLVD
ncbi:hypothetical protein ZIOFF_057030 [Zingiber officinale]|uniref:MACPF domain-containing protein n=1 Tax=Zingiber officinale TaxID=94328 RepID=A0A8J5KQ01_ZINOF|nr:hypothetical protein ZIOFF_057030 [Zingiber officinale]